MNSPLISKKIDIFGISISGIIVFALLKILNADSFFYIALTLMIAIVLDNGHVYMTYSRIKKEYSQEKLFFILTPMVIAIVLFLWLELKIPYFWSFVVYATFFHFVRQIYGINRWYMAKEKLKSKVIDFFVYALIILPILSIHFNQNMEITLYSKDDFISYKSSLLFAITLLLNIIAFFGWGISEYFIYRRRGSINIYRIVFVLSNAILFALVGYFAKNYIEVIIPLMMAHGFQYLILSSSLESKINNRKMLKVFMTLLAIGIVFGGIDTYLQDEFDMDNSYLYYGDTIENLLLALLLTPLFSHYIYDMKIWKSNYISKLQKRI